MTTSAKQKLFETYIGKKICFQGIINNNLIGYIEDTIKSVKTLENFDMVVVSLSNVKYMVNADIICVAEDNDNKIPVIEKHCLDFQEYVPDPT
jgi:hypothetical protein